MERKSKVNVNGWPFWAILGMLMSYGCVNTNASPEPPEMTSFDPWHDQTAIAFFYKGEAATLRQRAKELTGTAELYEELFGPDSDQVKSTRLLAQFYREAALQRERLAEVHRESAAIGSRRR